MKNQVLEGFFTKNQYIGENCLKKGAWTVFRLKRGLAKKRGVMFLRRWIDNPMHTMYSCLELIDDKLSFNRFNFQQDFSNKS